MFSIVDNSHIQKRHTIFPLDYTVQPRPLTQTSLEYQEHAIRLGKKVAEDCLARAGMKPEEIDWIITVSCTGYMIPSLDAYLIESMGFRRDVRRLPITEMGCAAGASALARAHDFLQCGPNKNILVISVELPSLTFQRRNFTPCEFDFQHSFWRWGRRGDSYQRRTRRLPAIGGRGAIFDAEFAGCHGI